MPVTHAKLKLDFDVARLRSDANAFTSDEWEPHFNRHYYEGDWSVIPLRAVKGSDRAIFPSPDAPDGYVATAMMGRCGYVPELLESFECEMQTVRLLSLSAGSVIRRHRDYVLGLEDGFVRIHIPVLTNDDVEFLLADERIDMKPGEAWYLNVNNYHSVRNGGATNRIHLVIDCVVNAWIERLIEEGVSRPATRDGD